MDSIIDNLDMATLSDLIDVVTKDTIMREVKKDEVFMKKVLKQRDVSMLIKILVRRGKLDILTNPSLNLATSSESTKGELVIPDDILEYAQDKNSVEFLLKNVIDLNKVNFIPHRHEIWVIDYIMSKPLKFKVNPNRKMRNGNTFWLDFDRRNIASTKLYLLASSATNSGKTERNIADNFTEFLDINAQTAHGNTLLHMITDIPDDFLALKPRYDIKNKNDEDALKYRKCLGYECHNLEKYIASLHTSNTSMGSNATENTREIYETQMQELQNANDRIIELEAKNKEYEAKYEQLQNILSNTLFTRK